jgi:flagellin
MALGVLNNISAINAQNNLANTQASLSKTLQQLSSGSRINSGADDAAGLSLANGLQASSTALSQSAKNASEGVDFLQVADGALSQVTSLLNRAITLATEASNGTLNSSQVAAANSEYQKILTETDTINNNTEYNGISTFAHNATYSTASATDAITVGVDSSSDAAFLSFSYKDAKTGLTDTAQIADFGTTTNATTAGTQVILTSAAPNLVTLKSGATLNDLATTLNSTAGYNVASVVNNQLVMTGGASLGAGTSVGVTESLVGNNSGQMSSLNLGTISDPTKDMVIVPSASGSPLDTSHLTVTVGNAAAVGVKITTPAGESANQLVTDINTAAGSNVASLSGNKLVLTGATIATGSSGSVAVKSPVNGTATNTSVSIFTSDGTISQSYNNATSDMVQASSSALSLAGTSLTSTTGAQAALTAINAAITSVAAARGTIGANINTLTAVGNVMTTQSTNTLAAMNDVTATDYGQATSDMSKYQILSQTGIAALSQANQAQQLITKLLQ